MTQIDQLQAENAQLREENAQLRAENTQLKARIVELELLVATLIEEIKLLKNGRNSKTSSSAPSSDIGRSNRISLRPKTGRASGGQKGHKGSTLEMSKAPDEIIEYYPDSPICKECGATLSEETYELSERKQDIFIPKIAPQYREHRGYSCICSHCKTVSKAELPRHLKATIQYHPSVHAYVAYFSALHYIPYKRTAQIMQDLFAIRLSEGTIDTMLTSITQKATAFIYPEIQSRVAQSVVVGGDETGIKINGKKAWLFTFQNSLFTFLSVSLSRGFSSISHLFAEGFPHSVYVSDCLPAQLKVAAKAHQLCTAHLLREFENFIVAFECQWSERFKQLLYDALALKKTMMPADYSLNKPEVVHLESRLNVLLAFDLTEKHPKVKALQKRLTKHRPSIFTFLYNDAVPPDNNGSERAIRNAKVKMKVSGHFKTWEGAQIFAILRSVIDTANKHAQNPLNGLIELADYQPAE